MSKPCQTGGLARQLGCDFRIVEVDVGNVEVGCDVEFQKRFQSYFCRCQIGLGCGERIAVGVPLRLNLRIVDPRQLARIHQCLGALHLILAHLHILACYGDSLLCIQDVEIFRQNLRLQCVALLVDTESRDALLHFIIFYLIAAYIAVKHCPRGVEVVGARIDIGCLVFRRRGVVDVALRGGEAERWLPLRFRLLERRLVALVVKNKSLQADVVAVGIVQTLAERPCRS